MSQQQHLDITPETETSEDADRILVTTTPALEGYRITKYIQIVAEETIVGTGFFSELAAWIADRFGAESKTISFKTRAARESSLKKLRERALELGADAVVGTSFSYSSNSRSMVSVIITGTAVNIAPVTVQSK